MLPARRDGGAPLSNMLKNDHTAPPIKITLPTIFKIAAIRIAATLKTPGGSLITYADGTWGVSGTPTSGQKPETPSRPRPASETGAASAVRPKRGASR